MVSFKGYMLSIAVVFTSVFSVCAEPLNEQDLAYLAQKKEIVFVAQPNHAPFEFIHKKNLSGMNVELVQWIAADMGFKVHFETAPLEQAMAMLETGEADAMSGLFYSKSRDAKFDFSNPIKRTPVSLFVRSNDEIIRTIYDLEGRKVAIMASSQAIETLQQNGVSCEMKLFQTMEECASLVCSGAADAMIGNELEALHFMYSKENCDLKPVGEPLFSARLSMAVSAGDIELLSILNKGIAAAQHNGTLHNIQAKWLGAEYARPKSAAVSSILTIAALSLIALSAIIVFILMLNRRLKREVEERTCQYAESEERLRLIFENSPDAVFMIEPDGQIITANARAAKFIGMEKSTLQRKRIHDLMPKELQQGVDENLKQWFASELSQGEGACITSDGSVIPVEITGSLQPMSGRQVLQLHLHDITLHKEAEEKLNNAQQMAEEAKEMAETARETAEAACQAKSEFLANMSHEIRTPLNGIVGMAQLLADTPLNDEQHNCVDTIEQSTAGLLNIINHVLDISKIEAGQMDVRETTIDLRVLCRNLFQHFNTSAELHGIKLRCECKDNVPMYVLGDEGLIEQILANLIGNAIKFTHHGTITLNIECHEKTPDGAELYFQIIDTGIGIDKIKQQTIFDKFTQADGSAKRLYGGSGLGLAISKKLVELMHGKIGVISAKGRGSTFFFNLTLPQASKPPAALPKQEHHIEQGFVRNSIRVLLVEDNHVNQKVAVAILKKAGFAVDTSDNGQDATQQIQRKQYNLILMDCQMPVMDGFEATTRIRSMPEPLCRIPIIAITAHAMKDDEQKCRDCGMNDYISKPVNRQDLINLVHKYASKHEAFLEN